MPDTRRSAASPRWGLMQKHWVQVDGEPFLDRRQILQTPWFSILLTRIHAVDGRDPHDHSRAFASLILRGGYDELVYRSADYLSPARLRSHRTGSLHVMPADCAHRITRIREPLTTLVIAGRHRGTWSFWTPAGKVDWKMYAPPDGDVN